MKGWEIRIKVSYFWWFTVENSLSVTFLRSLYKVQYFYLCKYLWNCIPRMNMHCVIRVLLWNMETRRYELVFLSCDPIHWDMGNCDSARNIVRFRIFWIGWLINLWIYYGDWGILYHLSWQTIPRFTDQGVPMHVIQMRVVCG